MFARFGIPPELLHAAGVRRVTDREARERLGVKHPGDLAGVLYPRCDPETGQERGYRLRRDHPEVDTTGAPLDKYLSSVDRVSLFWGPESAWLLPDVSVTVVVVESEKAALTIVAAAQRAQRHVLVVALGGCWGFRGRIGKTTDATGARVDEKGMLPDFDRIAWTDRDVVVLFDANAETNPSVRAARRTLAQELASRRACVRIATVPAEDGVNGPDDVLAIHGDAAVWNCIDAAIDHPAHAAGAGSPAPRISQSTQILQLARASRAEFFHDEDQAYAHTLADGHVETYLLRSKHGRGWLRRLYIDATGKCASSQAMTDALNTLEASALRGPAHRVHVRIAAIAGAIYIDLGDPERRIVEIVGGRGWRIVREAPVRFRRPRGFLPLPEPQGRGTISALRPFVNLSEDDYILLIAVLLAWLRGRGPYPALVLNGEQGSAKSTLARMVKALIDPTEAPLRSEPREGRDLMIAATNSHVLAFDNLSTLAPWLSDALCRLATGGGFSTRTLYEDREEEIFDAVRPVVLNGIAELATRPDLLSRVVLLTLPMIPDECRRDESTLWADFERARPLMLGALYDIISVALAREAGVTLAKKPRMADFVVWVTAAESACPWPAGAFMRVYDGNRLDATESALDGDPVAELARALALKGWTGTATELLTRLIEGTPEPTQRLAKFKHARQVSDALRRLAPALRQVGVEVDFPPRGAKRRLIVIRTQSESDRSGSSPASPASPAPETSSVPSDDGPAGEPAASSASSSGRPNDGGLRDDSDDGDEADPTPSSDGADDVREPF